MPTPVTMPVLGLTMEEGTVAAWLKRVGEPVEKDEPLLSVEMDKGIVEVPSPASGTLARIVEPVGQTVPVKTLIAEIAGAGEAISPVAAPAPALGGGVAGGSGDVASTMQQSTSEPTGVAAESVPAAAPAVNGQGGRQFVSPRARMRARGLGIELAGLVGSGPSGRIVEDDVVAAAAHASQAAPVGAAERVAATPLARRLAQEHGVSLVGLHGTGPGGRITQEDVLEAAARLHAQPPVAVPQAPAAVPTAEPQAPTCAPAPVSVPAATPQAGVAPLTRLRRITAERMAQSAHSVARVTMFLDADFTEAARFRQQLQPELARLGVAKLPWDALIAKAVGLALAEHPALNREWVEGQGLRQYEAVHVGVAVALDPEGLVVPVLRDADHRSLRELAGDLLGLVEKAQHGQLSPAEMQGGSFTITNLGSYRIDGFTPILNPPQAAILGVGRIAEKPAVVNGELTVRTLCTLSLAFDHRVVDGAPAAAFLARLAELLERPYTLLGI